MSVLSFLYEYFIEAVSAANLIPNITCTELRNKIASLELLGQQELQRSEDFVKENKVSKAKIKRMSKSNPIRIRYDELTGRAGKFFKEKNRHEKVLHARMVLKDKQGVVPFLAEVGYFEEYNSRISGNNARSRAMEKMNKAYPD